MQMTWFYVVSRKLGEKVNGGKIKVMILNGEEGLKCEVSGDRWDWSMCRNLNI